MSTIPTAVTHALNSVQDSSDALAAAKAQQTQALAALTSARQNQQAADKAVSDAQVKLNGDYQSLLSVLASTYEPPAVPSTPPSVPAAVPSTARRIG